MYIQEIKSGDEVFWNNFCICIDKKSIMYKTWSDVYVFWPISSMHYLDRDICTGATLVTVIGNLVNDGWY